MQNENPRYLATRTFSRFKPMEWTYSVSWKAVVIIFVSVLKHSIDRSKRGLMYLITASFQLTNKQRLSAKQRR